MTIYLTNNATVAAVDRGSTNPASRAAVGRGLVLSIMRFPRDEMGESGAGRVLALTPPRQLVMPAIKAKHASDAGDDQATAAWREYESALRARWTVKIGMLAPGVLTYGKEDAGGQQSWDGSRWTLLGTVRDGSTLICACSREAAAAGRCHRVIAADLLGQAGWEVVLDGVDQTRRIS